MESSDHEILTAHEVSAMLRVHYSTVMRLAKERKIPAFRLGTGGRGGDWRFVRSKLQRWMRSGGCAAVDAGYGGRAMNEPKWQRARMLVSDTPEAVGLTIWVRIGPPAYVGAISAQSGRRLPPEERVQVNILPVHHQCRRSMIRSARLELLARGPEDFADDVELITWEQWLKESAPEKPA